MLDQEYVYDENLTKQYIDRELRKLNLERKKTLDEYNNLIAEFNNSKETISSVSNKYSEAYKKVLEVGTIGSLPIKNTEKLLETSNDIDELVTSINDLISQINKLIKEYELEYNSKVAEIKNHREYRLVTVREEL